MKLYIIILILLALYLILVNCNKEHFDSNISVYNRYIDIVTAVDEALIIFKNIINTEYTKEVKINLLKNEIIKGYSLSNVGRVRQFCAFPEGLYSYFYLFLLYTEYKKNNKIDKYVNNLIKKSNNIDRVIVNRINNTKLNFNKNKKYKDIYRFLPDSRGNLKVKQDIKKQKKIFINELHNAFQNNNVNPKSIIIFKKDIFSVEKDETDKDVFRYLITQKIALKSVKSNVPLTWDKIKKTYCKDIVKNPEDIFTYELLIELIKTKNTVYCKSLDIQNLCMLSLRPCFKEKMDTSEINYTPANTGREVTTGRVSGLDTRKASTYISKDDQLNNFSKKLRDRLEIYSISGKAGNCFDKDNNILLDKKRRTDCPKEFTWSLPCTRDRDCPYYKRNSNYTNEYGKCNNNYCEVPLGVKEMGYNTRPNMTRKNNINDAFCYNCKTPNPRCCSKQKEPDYAFKNDYQERLKKRKELAKKGLKVKNETIDIEKILMYTNFV